MRLEEFFNPKSIAVIGASRTPGKLGHTILENLKISFKGNLYPINPNTGEILGLEAYPSVIDVEEPIDLAIIVVPAEIVEKILKECVKKRIKAVIIISSGFSEIEEKERELELKNIIKNRKTRIIGPNCLSGSTSILVTNDNHIKCTKMGELIDYWVQKYPNNVYNISKTYILPTNKLKKIIKVLSWDGKEFVFKKVKNFFKRRGEAFKVTIEGGRELICSPDHPFLIKMPWGFEETLCRDLEIGQSIPIMFNFSDPKEIREINLFEEVDEKVPENVKSKIRFKWDKTYTLDEFAELCLKEELRRTWITTKHGRVMLPTILPITDELCRLLGFFIADGNYDKNWLSIGYTESKEENEEIRRCINEVFSCDISKDTKDGKIKFGRLIGKILFENVFEIGRYSENKSIPNFIYSLSPEKIIAFLFGLFSGDGCIYWNRKKDKCALCFCSTSKKLIQQTSLLLSRLGIGPFYISKRRRSEAWFKGKRYSAKDLYSLTTNSKQAIRKLVELGFLFFDSKQNKKLLEVAKSGKKFKNRVKGNLYFRKIKKIEKLEGEHNLYDFEVDGTHTFVANQILTHNCIGIYKKDLDMIFFPRNRLKRPPEGSISFITQSGAFGSILLDIIAYEGVGVSKFISIGNKIDVDEIDLLEYLENDLNTRCIAIYIESISDGKEFIKTAKRITKKKPIVCFKAGKTEKGNEAVLSHTGTLAGSAEIYSAAFKQARIIEAKSSEEIFDFAKALANQPVMKNNNIAVVTDGGGFGIVATDAAIKYGLELPKLTDESLKELKSFLPKYAITKNPIDLTGDATVERYQKALEITLKDKNIVGVACIALMQIPTLTDDIVDVLRDCKVFGKPIVVCSAGGQYILERNRKLEAFGIPVYPTPERAVKALSILYKYGKALKKG